MLVICGSIRVELSQVEFLDLSQANYFENFCEEFLRGNVRGEALSKRRKLMDELEIDITELREWLEGAEGAGSCAEACKAQASARVDVPTAPMTK